MRIIHLDRHLLIDLPDIVVRSFILGDRRLQACRYEEILLLKPQFLSCIMIIIRIQDFYNILRKILLLNSLVIISAVERFQLEVNDRFRIPDTQCIHNMVIITDDRVIIRNRLNGFVILLNETDLSLVVIFYTDISAEADFFCVFRTPEFKWIPVRKPVIRRLHLVTILDLLLKHTVPITDPASVRRISQGCQ